MKRHELIAIVKRSHSDTLIAQRMRDALGLPRYVSTNHHGHVRDKSAKSRRYRNARKLMRQKYGVRQ